MTFQESNASYLHRVYGPRLYPHVVSLPNSPHLLIELYKRCNRALPDYLTNSSNLIQNLHLTRELKAQLYKASKIEGMDPRAILESVPNASANKSVSSMSEFAPRNQLLSKKLGKSKKKKSDRESDFKANKKSKRKFLGAGMNLPSNWQQMHGAPTSYQSGGGYRHSTSTSPTRNQLKRLHQQKGRSRPAGEKSPHHHHASEEEESSDEEEETDRDDESDGDLWGHLDEIQTTWSADARRQPTSSSSTSGFVYHRPMPPMTFQSSSPLGSLHHGGSSIVSSMKKNAAWARKALDHEVHQLPSGRSRVFYREPLLRRRSCASASTQSKPPLSMHQQRP